MGGEGGLFPFNPVLCSGRFRNHNYDLNTPLCQTHFAFPLVPGLSVYFFISIHVISLTTLYMWTVSEAVQAEKNNKREGKD